MRTVLEQFCRFLDGWGLHHKIAADVIAGRRDPVLAHPQGLAHHAAAVGKVRQVLLLPLHPLWQTGAVDRVLLGFGQRPEAVNGFGVHHVNGEEAGHDNHYENADLFPAQKSYFAAFILVTKSVTLVLRSSGHSSVWMATTLFAKSVFFTEVGSRTCCRLSFGIETPRVVF